MSLRVALALTLSVVAAARPGVARADRAAVVVLPGPGGDRAAALRALPALAKASARAVQTRLDRAQPARDALATLEAARATAREQMASFTELDQAESAVAVALAAGFDALPHLDDVSVPVRLAFDLATVRLALGDRDGAGEALGLSARLDPAVTTDPSEHPPALQALANEVRPPPGSPPPPLPVARTRALGGLLGVDVLVIARAAVGGGVDVFVVRAFDGVATLQGTVPRGGRLDARLQARLVELHLAQPAPEGAIGDGHGRGGGGGSPWPWLAPTLIGVVVAAGAVLYFALPSARDDANVRPGMVKASLAAVLLVVAAGCGGEEFDVGLCPSPELLDRNADLLERVQVLRLGFQELDGGTVVSEDVVQGSADGFSAEGVAESGARLSIWVEGLESDEATRPLIAGSTSGTVTVGGLRPVCVCVTEPSAWERECAEKSCSFDGACTFP